MARADGRVRRVGVPPWARAHFALLVMIPSYFRPCGTLSPSEQVQLPAFVVTCATALLACPRTRLHHKALTLVCYTLSAVLVIGLGGRYFVHLFSDQAAIHLTHAYKWVGAWPATPNPKRCGA